MKLDSCPILSQLRHSRSWLRYRNKSTHARNPASYAGYQKLGVCDQNFRTGRQQATNLLSHQHMKFQGKSAFLKENMKLPWAIVVKRSGDFTITIFTWCHTVSVASPNTDIVGENVTWRDRSVGLRLVSISQIGLEYVVMRTQINFLLSPEYSD